MIFGLASANFVVVKNWRLAQRPAHHVRRRQHHMGARHVLQFEEREGRDREMVDAPRAADWTSPHRRRDDRAAPCWRRASTTDRRRTVSAAAICSTIAWVEILTVGTAILSLGPISFNDLMLGSRLISVIGCAEVATMPLTPPRVRSHSSSRLPVPVLRISTPPASSASVCAPPPLKVTHLVVTPGSAERGRVLLDQLLLLDDVASACRRCPAAATARCRSSAGRRRRRDRARREQGEKAGADPFHHLVHCASSRHRPPLTATLEMH